MYDPGISASSVISKCNLLHKYSYNLQDITTPFKVLVIQYPLNHTEDLWKLYPGWIKMSSTKYPDLVQSSSVQANFYQFVQYVCQLENAFNFGLGKFWVNSVWFRWQSICIISGVISGCQGWLNWIRFSFSRSKLLLSNVELNRPESQSSCPL